MPVGGSRHYQGPGLGQVGLWRCPACGEDNTGPLEQGCTVCGSGKPGSVAGPPPPPRVSERAPDDPTYHTAREDHPIDFAEAWARRNSAVSIAEAYRAGYAEGMRAAREQLMQQQPVQGGTMGGDARSARTYRTIRMALALFRDQVLATDPEEVVSGEWMTVAETNDVIRQLGESLGMPREVVHG